MSLKVQLQQSEKELEANHSKTTKRKEKLSTTDTFKGNKL